MSAGIRVLLYHRTSDSEAIHDAYRRVSTEMANVPGMLGNELLRAEHDAECFVVLSSWKSKEAFDAWEQGPTHKDTTKPLRPFRDGQLDRPFGIFQVTAKY